MIELRGRAVRKQVESEPGWTLLDLALKHDVDWGFSCTRGTCARCRCQITEGMEFVSEPSDAERDRLDDEELEQGFRLGCQVKIHTAGAVAAVWKPYF